MDENCGFIWSLGARIINQNICCFVRWCVHICMEWAKKGKHVWRKRNSFLCYIELLYVCQLEYPTWHNDNNETSHPINLFKSCYNVVQTEYVVGCYTKCIPMHTHAHYHHHNDYHCRQYGSWSRLYASYPTQEYK